MIDRVEQGEREMEDEGAPPPPEPMPSPPQEPSEPQQPTDDQQRRPTSGIVDELGQQRTPERYIKNLVGVFRLRLRARRARPESR